MSTIEESFAKLLGRQPSDKDRQDLFRTRDALSLKNNDALWLVLMALGHYETIYGRFPALIARAAADVTEKTRAAAEADLKAASAKARAELARSVADAAREIADQRASTKRLQWIAGSLAAGAAVLITIGILGYLSGRSSGRAQGYEEARDERAAVAWANTPEGQLAYGLAKAGSIRDLATCGGRGWVVKGTVCFPHSDDGSVYGWNISPP